MQSIADVLRRFKQSWNEELSPVAIAQACRDAGMNWNESALNPIVTIQVFFVQILHGNTAIEHLKHLTGIENGSERFNEQREYLMPLIFAATRTPFSQTFPESCCNVPLALL